MADRLAVRLGAAAPPDWDDWVAAAGEAAGYGQTTHWAALAAASRRASPHFISVLAEGRRVAGALLVHDRAVGPFPRIPGFAGRLSCLDGPVLLQPLPGVGEALREAVEQIRRGTGGAAVDVVAPPTAPRRDAAVGHFADGGWVSDLRATSLVPLDGDEAGLWRRISKGARRNIRRAEDAGVVVQEILDRDEYRSRFLPALRARIDVRRRLRPADDLAMWDLGHGTTHRFFVAVHDDAVLGTLGTYRWQGVATEIASGRTPASVETALAVQDVLHWAVLRHHCAAGDRTFDLAGYQPAPSDEKERGIRQYKRKWGGTEVLVPVARRSASAPVDRLLRAVRPNG